MPTSKKRTTRKSGKGKQRTPKEEAAQRPVDGVLVHLLPTEGGDKQITVSALGETRLTEAPTILRMAAHDAERELGIG